MQAGGPGLTSTKRTRRLTHTAAATTAATAASQNIGAANKVRTDGWNHRLPLE